MATIADLTIADGLSTPVNRTFEASRTQNATSPSQWDYKTGASKLAWIKLQHDCREVKGKDLTREFTRVELPQLNAAGDLDHYLSSMVTFNIPDKATQAAIDDLVAFTINAINVAAMKAALKARATFI